MPSTSFITGSFLRASSTDSGSSSVSCTGASEPTLPMSPASGSLEVLPATRFTTATSLSISSATARILCASEWLESVSLNVDVWSFVSTSPALPVSGPLAAGLTCESLIPSVSSTKFECDQKSSSACDARPSASAVSCVSGLAAFAPPVAAAPSPGFAPPWSAAFFSSAALRAASSSRLRCAAASAAALACASLCALRSARTWSRSRSHFWT